MLKSIFFHRFNSGGEEKERVFVEAALYADGIRRNFLFFQPSFLPAQKTFRKRREMTGKN